MFSNIAAGIRRLRGNPRVNQELVTILEQLAAGYATRIHRGQIRVERDGYRHVSARVLADGDTQVWPDFAAMFTNPASRYDNASDQIIDGAALATQGVVFLRTNDGGISLISTGDAKLRNALVMGDVLNEDGTLYQFPGFTIGDCAEWWEASSVAGASDWGRASGVGLLDSGSVARVSGWLTDNAWDFGHTTGQLLSSGSVSLDYDSDWTVILGVNIDTLSGYDPVLWSYGDDGTTKPLFCRVNASGGTLAVVATDNGTTARTTTGTTALVTGTNYLLAFTWDASSETISLYIDGELETSADLSAYTWPTFTDPQLRIGNRVDNTTGQELDGQVDTVAVLSSCLSARQIGWYYQALTEGNFVGGNRGQDIQDAILASCAYGKASLWP